MNDPRKQFAVASVVCTLIALFWTMHFALKGEGYELIYALSTLVMFVIATAITVSKTPVSNPTNSDHQPDSESAFVYLGDILNELPQGDYVYIIQDISNSGYCKIGRTTELSKRLTKFAVKLPIEIKLVHLIPCDNSHIAERSLHLHFAGSRKRGEWFALTTSDIRFIQSIKSM